MKLMRLVKLMLKIAIPTLIFSGVMDLALWFLCEFHVPSWAISAMSFSTAILIFVLYRVIR